MDFWALSVVNVFFFFLLIAPLYNDPGSVSVVIEDDFNDEEAWGEIKRQAGSNAEHLTNANRDDYDDDDDDKDEDSDVTISDIFSLVTSTPPAHLKGGRAQITTEQAAVSGADGIIASTPPTSALVTKLFPQLKPKQKATVSRAGGWGMIFHNSCCLKTLFSYRSSAMIRLLMATSKKELLV